MPQVYCLCVDLIGSTKAGLEMTTTQLDRFNRSLVEQIEPHLESLGLADAPLKFEGDGWLLMTDEDEKVPALCCLGTIMAKRFAIEMSEKTGIATDHVPPLRVAICSGRDLRVELPDGRVDWVGDSARRATRACQPCAPGEILVDEVIRQHVFRDFAVSQVDLEQRAREHPAMKMEEDFPLWILGDLKAEAATELGAPEHFVYTLGAIGQYDEAAATVDALHAKGVRPDVITRSYNALISQAPSYAEAKERLEIMRTEGIQPDVVTYNTLIAKAPGYPTAKAWLDAMREEGIEPDVFTYSILIAQAPDYPTAKAWLDTMRGEGIQPNVVTYNTLIAQAPDHPTAKAWLDTMREEGIPPNVVTYSTLMAKAPDYATARSWLDTMREEGIPPNVVTYSTLIDQAPDYATAKDWLDTMRAAGVQPNLFAYNSLFTKDLSGQSAAEILRWYLAQPYHPEQPIQAAIASYRSKNLIDQALRLTLDYPHLPAARSLIRKHSEKALSYFGELFERDPDHPNHSYALGLALIEVEREQEALPYLSKALRLAKHGPRKQTIGEWLLQIERRGSQRQQ